MMTEELKKEIEMRAKIETSKMAEGGRVEVRWNDGVTYSWKAWDSSFDVNYANNATELDRNELARRAVVSMTSVESTLNGCGVNA